MTLNVQLILAVVSNVGLLNFYCGSSSELLKNRLMINKFTNSAYCMCHTFDLVS